MKFPTKSDIVPLFQGIVNAILPFAESNQVKLTFRSAIDELILVYNPAHIVSDVTELLCNVIAFTPQNYTVETDLYEVEKGNGHFLTFRVHNDGANLSRIKEITASLYNNYTVSVPKPKSTVYCLFISEIEQDDESGIENPVKIDHYGIPPLYAKVKRGLQSHFCNIESLEKSTARKSQRQGVFLQKVNSLILSNLDREDFSTIQLCDGLALSRSQLYRKLKTITHLSPAHYIQYFRLQKAKEFLQNTDMNVGEVVLKVGFASHSHFTRAFHNQFGINPSYLRKTATQIPDRS